MVAEIEKSHSSEKRCGLEKMCSSEKRYDLHVHSTRSHDGTISPEKIVEVARSRGLRGVAVTDHNTVRGAIEAKRYETEDFEVIVGSEIKTDRGDLIGLFLHREIASRSFSDAVLEIREQGGLSVIPHPFDELRRSAMNPSEEEAMMVDALEAFNSRCLFKSCNDKARKLSVKLGKGITAGSDAHFEEEIGNAYIATDSEDLRSAIAQGRVDVFGKRSSALSYSKSLASSLGRREENV